MKIFDILINNPELAKNIKFEITGDNLLALSATLINATNNSHSVKQKEDYLTIKDVCKLVNRDRRTLSNWNKKKILTPNHIGLYKKSDIDKFLEKK